MNEIMYRAEKISIENNFIIDLLLDSPINDSHASCPYISSSNFNESVFFSLHFVIIFSLLIQIWCIFKPERQFKRFTDEKRKNRAKRNYFFKWQHKNEMKRYVNSSDDLLESISFHWNRGKKIIIIITNVSQHTHTQKNRSNWTKRFVKHLTAQQNCKEISSNNDILTDCRLLYYKRVVFGLPHRLPQFHWSIQYNFKYFSLIFHDTLIL